MTSSSTAPITSLHATSATTSHSSSKNQTFTPPSSVLKVNSVSLHHTLGGHAIAACCLILPMPAVCLVVQKLESSAFCQGIMGSLQAMEAIKIILGCGTPPLGRLIHYDALNTSFREFNLRRDPQCPLCGENPSITHLIDYEQTLQQQY